MFCKCSGSKTQVFVFFPGVLEGLGSSGRLIGTISTYPGTCKCPCLVHRALLNGYIRKLVAYTLTFSSNSWSSISQCFVAFPRGPGGFRKLREACRNHFHLSRYLKMPRVTNYGQKLWGVTFSSLYGMPKEGILEVNEENILTA